MTPTATSAIERRAKPPKAAASLKGGNTLALFELGRNAGEGRVHICPNGVDNGDDHSSDARCDQAIFDRRCTRFIPAESN
jgi:hypothetical protein